MRQSTRTDISARALKYRRCHLNPVIAKLAAGKTVYGLIMIESVEGLENLDQIAGVPGVGALFLGAGSDLSRSMGVPASSPEVEAAFQQVLKACKAHKVACGIHSIDGACDYASTRPARGSLGLKNPIDLAHHRRAGFARVVR